MKKTLKRQADARRRSVAENGNLPEVEVLRNELRSLVAQAAREMVETAIRQAMRGQYQAMKYLFEMVGLFPADAETAASQQDPLAAELLKRLGIAHAVQDAEGH